MFLLSFSVQQTTYRIGNHVCISLGMVEARSVNNVKKTTTKQTGQRGPQSIVDILNIIQTVQDTTRIHLKVYEDKEPKSSRRGLQQSER